MTHNWHAKLQTEVHLYFADPSVIAADPSALTLLDPQERARYERFMFAHSKTEFCGAHALLRSVLSRYQPAVGPREWEFVSNPWGRPSLAHTHHNDSLRFNLSHTTGLICVAITHARELGVDVEFTQRAGQTTEIAERFFAPTEVSDLNALATEHQRARFFSYWTLKESYIKARGMGLAIPLDQFAFSIEGDERIVSPTAPLRLATSIALRCEPSLNDDATRWTFTQFALTPSHMAAVAVERHPHSTITVQSVGSLSELADPTMLFGQ